MPTKEQLKAELQKLEKQAQDGGRMVEEGRRLQHSAARRTHEVNLEIDKIEREAREAAEAAAQKESNPSTK